MEYADWRCLAGGIIASALRSIGSESSAMQSLLMVELKRKGHALLDELAGVCDDTFVAKRRKERNKVYRIIARHFRVRDKHAHFHEMRDIEFLKRVVAFLESKLEQKNRLRTEEWRQPNRELRPTPFIEDIYVPRTMTDIVKFFFTWSL